MIIQLKLQRKLKKINNKIEIEDIEKLKRKVEAQKAMKIFITPAENGFNVAIDIENSKNMSTEEHELVGTIARGLVFQATTDPHSTFLMGLKGLKNDKEKKRDLKKEEIQSISHSWYCRFYNFLKIIEQWWRIKRS